MALVFVSALSTLPLSTVERRTLERNFLHKFTLRWNSSITKILADMSHVIVLKLTVMRLELLCSVKLLYWIET